MNQVTLAQEQPPTPPDTLAAAPPDTLVSNLETDDDEDETDVVDPSGITSPIQFAASDSLVFVFSDQYGDTGQLWGNSKVTYDNLTMDAHAIFVLFERKELQAKGVLSDSGWVGRPQLKQGETTFTGASFAYNMETKRGRVVGSNTSYEDGFLRSDVAKVREDSTLFVSQGSYTTCECGPEETPSYSLRSSKMKVVDKKWIYTGPIRLYLFNIPTPFWLPFGFLPAQEGRRSGPLPPEYGEDGRGFYLRNWGYYWAISDYMDLQVRAGLWTLGSWQIHPAFRYKKRDYFDGSLDIDYFRERNGERDDPDFRVNNNVRIQWRHNQTITPSSSLSGNIDMSSSGYLRTVSYQYQDNVRQSIGSSLQYGKSWRSAGRQLSVNMRQNHVLATGEVDMTLPDVSFSQSSQTPFKQENRPAGTREKWFERLTVSYSGRLNNQYNFRPLEGTNISWYEALFNAEKYEQATGKAVPLEFQGSHRIPISVPFTVNRLPLLNTPLTLNLTPQFSYSENWYLKTERRALDSTQTVQTEAIPGFFALRQFSSGVGLNTALYGLFPIKVGAYQGLRHTARTSMSLSYQPDFSSDFWGYMRTYADATGKEIQYPIVNSVPRGLQQALSFNLDNVFETKHVSTDSTGEAQRRNIQLLNLSLNASYNFAADSLKLSPISMSARTTLFQKLSVNLNATLSPYALHTNGQRIIDKYYFSIPDFRFGRMTHFSAVGGFSLRKSGSRGTMLAPGTTFDEDDFADTGLSSLGLSQQQRFPTDFAIPWSLDIQFSYSVSKPLQTLSRNATVNTTFSFNLTPLWKVQGNSGYDFEQKQIVTSVLNLSRDLGCWEMGFRWVPFGRFQSWGFDLHVKSGKLKDFLKIQQPRSDVRPNFF